MIFFIPGHPKTAGSKRAFFNKHTGKAMVIDTCNNKDWKTACAWKGKEQGVQPFTVPLSLTVTFVMPRPKSHYHVGKKAGQLRLDAPVWHSSKPDATKLVRCLEDALTGILWRDDSLIVKQDIRKVYGEEIGAVVAVEVIELSSVCR